MLRRGIIPRDVAKQLLCHARRGIGSSPNVYLFLDAKATTCQERIRGREKKAESEMIPLDYLQDLEKAHVEWMQSDRRVIRVGAERPAAWVAQDVARIIEREWEYNRTLFNLRQANKTFAEY
jgi:thymidylate kinase